MERWRLAVEVFALWKLSLLLAEDEKRDTHRQPAPRPQRISTNVAGHTMGRVALEDRIAQRISADVSRHATERFSFEDGISHCFSANGSSHTADWFAAAKRGRTQRFSAKILEIQIPQPNNSLMHDF